MASATDFLAGLSLFEAIGMVGVAFYLGAFAALQMGLLDGNGRLYAVANILGASCVLISLYEAFNLASAVIQISWIVIGTIGLLRLAFGRVRPGPRELGRFAPDAR